MEVPESLIIDVGPLSSVTSFHHHVAPALRRFGKLYRDGHPPAVEWDLRHVQPKRMSTFALTAFLAVADRVSDFTSATPIGLLDWNPKSLGFWNDIGFLQHIKDLRILEWKPKEYLGGFSALHGETNPDSSLMVFPAAPNAPKREQLAEWQRWKDGVRFEVKRKLSPLPRMIGRRNALVSGSINSSRLSDILSEIFAELVLNTLEWAGGVPAFIGIQRSTYGRFTAAVCDSGDGLLKSLRVQAEMRPALLNLTSSTDAVLVASLINYRSFGLRKAIEAVISRGGYIQISSGNAEVRWCRGLWERLAPTIGQDGLDFDVAAIRENAGPGIRTTSLGDRRFGFHRTWAQSIPGVRISFELPTGEETHDRAYISK